jgi:hypothetical protein
MKEEMNAIKDNKITRRGHFVICHKDVELSV